MQRSASRSAAAAASSQTLVIRRTLDARRELVFKAWTDPGSVCHWWGPHGFSCPVCKIEACIGGKIQIDMLDPQGNILPILGQFLEFDPPSKLVFEATHLRVDGTVNHEALHTVTFAESECGRKTELLFEVRLTERFQRSYTGMQSGWTQTLDRFTAQFGKYRTES